MLHYIFENNSLCRVYRYNRARYTAHALITEFVISRFESLSLPHSL